MRIPNLFEPYWYGDEAIYLTVGTGLRQGLVLYKDIIDHKTPLIYVFAMLPSQFWFKLLFLAWTGGSLILFYSIAIRIIRSKVGVAIATTLFMLASTLPWFEGHIANGELFVVGFILAGMAIFVRSNLFESFEKSHKEFVVQPWHMGLIGSFFSLGVLTKVPAIFDIAVVLATFAFFYILSPTMHLFSHLVKSGIAMLVGFAVPILGSILYFASKQALTEYLNYGLLYNFRYSSYFSVPDLNPIIRYVYTMNGKLTVVAVIFFLLAFILKNAIRPLFRFTFMWFTLALFASLLSSRPYPHYFQQVFPPLALLAGLLFSQWKSVIEKFLVCVAFFSFVGTLVVLHAGLYGITPYYKNFVQFATRNISTIEYRSRFNPLVNDTYKVARYIQTTTSPTDRIFVWGTNPMLYALSKRVPSGRFTVSFHIKDFYAYEETMQAIARTNPPVIVVMADENGEFKQFYSYLVSKYTRVMNYPTMTIYRRMALP
ncbi:MAG TPA: hypothetical protein VJ246_03475 [Patescibacteria group bacterium]|nr:hypothetical protein [Patescibacteria group bacterium]